MIVVLIAAYNEGPRLKGVLPRIPTTVLGHEVTVIVASDGSSDDTVPVARQAGCATVAAAMNRGKGATLRLGIAAIEEIDYDVLVLMDGDGQHRPDDIEALVRPIAAGTADMVIGSRYSGSCWREQAPWNRYAVRCVTTTLLERLLGRRYSDPYCGFRAMTRDTVAYMDLEGDRYQSELEMLFAASRHELRVAEVPIAKVYGPETTKMGAGRGAFLGRLNVIGQYTGTIARRTIRLRRSGRRPNQSRIPA